MDSLFDRMKKYEDEFRTTLPLGVPIIFRLDGKAFHTYTRSMPDRPFNRDMMSIMETTAIEVCREVQGAQLAYVQSDEISVLVHGYKTPTSEIWFGGQVQKMVSVAASIAGATFTMNSWKIWQKDDVENRIGYIEPAYFDCRVFTLPEFEVCNYFIWRQQDSIRNSIQSHARSVFSPTQCHKKSCEELKKMCDDARKPWEKLTPSFRNGRVVQRMTTEKNGTVRSHWQTDYNVPLFNVDRGYIDRHLQKEE